MSLLYEMLSWALQILRSVPSLLQVYEKKVQHLTNYNTVEQQPSWSIPAG